MIYRKFAIRHSGHGLSNKPKVQYSTHNEPFDEQTKSHDLSEHQTSLVFRSTLVIKKFNPFYLASLEIIDVKVCNKQTDKS